MALDLAPRLCLDRVSFDIPVLDARRSFRTAVRASVVERFTGGRISREGSGRDRVLIRALENICCDLQPGDRIGLVGHNGAGKSTLLKIMGGIYTPTSGVVHRTGSLIPMLNPHLGIDSEDTGYENILNLAMIYGTSRERLRNQFAHIEEVSELGHFLNLPVRTYSSGMVVRLVVAILTCLECDILLLDEGIGAADAHFAERADARLSELCDRVKILVLASHSEAMIRRFCNKALLLEHGQVRAYGPVDDVMRVYSGANAAQ